MSEIVISGIQQIGIGVKDVHEAWGWYKKYFGIDIRILEDTSIAEYMLPYTGGEPKSRHAAIAISLKGGGGFEIWNHRDFEPRSASFNVQLGDLGFFAAKIKSADPCLVYEWYNKEDQQLVGRSSEFNGHMQFFFNDPYGNLFQVVRGNSFFRNENKLTGGGFGAIVGCTDVERSLHFYKTILGYDTVVFDETGVFDDLRALPGGDKEFRRVLLRHSKPRSGPFSKLFGDSEIELVQVLNRKPKKIFENRFWGELGFIHLCYDIQGMKELRSLCEKEGFPFTVDTLELLEDKSFDMGDAAGLFAYVEDPDGALIEFVETHKLPIIKKLGISLNLKKRKKGKSLPIYLLNALRFLKATDIKEPLIAAKNIA
jgi:catechol 2,3-dioxygenase-like lactoylglutathione lyase family enzyme